MRTTNSRKIKLSAAAAVLMGLAFAAQAAVTTNTWNGGGANGNWTTGGNWGGTAPSTAAGVTNALVFGGTSQLSMNNDYTSFLAGLGISANNTGVTFTNDNTSGKTGQFTLSGNKLLLGGNIQSTQVNSGSLTDTIALDMQIKGGTRVITAAKNHSIEVSGVISEDAGGKVLTTTGNSDNSGKVKLSGLNTFTGDMKLNGGTTVMNTLANTNVASSAGKGSVIWIGAGTVDTTLEYTGAATSTDRKILLGIDSGTQNSGSRIDNNGSGTLSFTRATFNDTRLSVGSTRTLTLGGSNNGVIDGIIQDNSSTGAVALVKAGAGTWTLKGNNIYTGTTIVSNGLLVVDGSLAGGAVTVKSGATLGGSGNIGGVTTIDGMLKPGNSPGTLTFANALNLNADSTTTFEIASLTSFDVLKGSVTNIITFANGADVIFDFTGYTGGAASFQVLTNWSSIASAGTINFLTNNLAEGLTLDTSNFVNTGVITVIPEPATIGMLGLGALVTLLIRRMSTR
jgi:autotransporter-associated beta strand protein